MSHAVAREAAQRKPAVEIAKQAGSVVKVVALAQHHGCERVVPALS